MEVMMNSKQYKRSEVLNNISFIDIAEGISECHANYTVLTKLNPNIPKESIELAKIDLLNGLHDIAGMNKNRLPKSYFYRRMIDWSIKANDLFIYQKWNILKDYFDKYHLQELSEFAYNLNVKFLNVVKNYENIDSMKDPILSLAEETNDVDVYDVIKG